MEASSPRIPTHLWVEAKISELLSKGIGIYVLQKGERNDGTVLLKISNCRGKCKLLIQQRNFDSGELEWINALSDDVIEDIKADEYIKRSVNRDPDQWVVEVENPNMDNVFLD